MSDIKALTEKIVKFRDARDWKQFHNPKDMSLSLVLEATEVMEHFQWRSLEEMKTYVKSHKHEIGEELADVLYWVLLMSSDLKIDIKDALEKKLRVQEKKYPIEKAKGSHKKYTEL
ncbi:MAG TPA: nucleotide pyrophosphohydrolase [Candidatus Wunengus sp. YC60]|uniref:nucleotide pyrophosphohydrolase n=1 Tax=Candidatus Wunengus sp. YC60 TaxID=3367697 RepID=UPI0040296990